MDAPVNIPPAPEKIEDIELRLLLEALYLRYHYDFRNYAMASVKRRLRQARDQLGFSSISAMQEAVLHDQSQLPRLFGYLTVQVSEMFRDPTYFHAIREKVVPHLRTYPSLKVWVAGCSGGEELYSLVILFREEDWNNGRSSMPPTSARTRCGRPRLASIDRPDPAVHRKPSPLRRKVVPLRLL